MAKDVSNKTNSGNSYGNTSPSLLDSQKVPPLRIVLNTAAGNQKAPTANSLGTTTLALQDNQPPRSTTKNKQQDPKQSTDSSSIKGGRFRIKLGSNKQLANRTTYNPDTSGNNTNTAENEEIQNNLTSSVGSSNSISHKEEPSSSSNRSSNYLRRITRRSQRSVQVISNEDEEESISSMTSTDENQNTQISNSDSNLAQESSSVASNQSSINNTASANGPSTTSGTSNSQSAETSRKYKKRKADNSESLTNEQLLFSLQNYSVPVQNSFKLFKNIRQQVDKKLDTLNTSLHPIAPRGFREYMIAKGAYLLDGNRLGNGVNLTTNENGGMNISRIGRLSSRNINRVNYFIPDRATVPLNIPRDSPLHHLFIEQEKERYRMRIQHIKEREKLTLAAEQEIMRVYNQAAMASNNQAEPLSVCTMLKHQEIYNYMDSDGVPIQANEENSQDEVSQEGVRTRRRNHDHVSQPQVRKTSNATENEPEESKTNNETTEDSGKIKEPEDKEPMEKTEELDDDNEGRRSTLNVSKEIASPGIENAGDCSADKYPSKKLKTYSGCDRKNEHDDKELHKPTLDTLDVNKKPQLDQSDDADQVMEGDEGLEDKSSERVATKVKEEDDSIKDVMIDKDSNESAYKVEESKVEVEEIRNPHDTTTEDDAKQVGEKEDTQGGETEGLNPKDQEDSAQDLQSQFKEVFVGQLQEIDDKWEKIRADMLIRHRNEAESLHAVQRLEWEWKTKEIGAIDVRSTLVIDDVLVPKLAIYSQDY